MKLRLVFVVSMSATAKTLNVKFGSFIGQLFLYFFIKSS